MSLGIPPKNKNIILDFQINDINNSNKRSETTNQQGSVKKDIPLTINTLDYKNSLLKKAEEEKQRKIKQEAKRQYLANTYGKALIHENVEQQNAIEQAIPIVERREEFNQAPITESVKMIGEMALALSSVPGFGLSKGIENISAGLLKSFQPKIKSPSFQMDIYDVKNYDDIFKLSDDDLAKVSSHDKESWKLIGEKKGPDEAYRRFSSGMHSKDYEKWLTAKDVEPTIDDMIAITTGKEMQEYWLNSPEWLKRRMRLANQSEKEANRTRLMSLSNLRNTTVKLKDVPNATSGGIQIMENDKPTIMINNDAVNKFMVANHEFIHASNAGPREFLLKGIVPPKYQKPTNAVQQGTLDYLSSLSESQVRGVRALQHLRKKGLWSGGEITDAHILQLERDSYLGGDLAHDVKNLVVNIESKNELKKFLNNVYGISGFVLGSSMIKKNKIQ